jgi:hypothetical protein
LQEEEAHPEANDDSSDGELEYKQEHRFPNGAIYKGGWKNGMRHGEGTQVWVFMIYFELSGAENVLNEYKLVFRR